MKKWYNTAEWQRIRRVVMERDAYICQACNGAVIPGDRYLQPVIDHKIAHKGDWEVFNDLDNLQLLHKSCHDRKTAFENRGREPDYGTALDGWPIEQR